ncbi:MAG: (2Fe-2S)-binding protein [Hyphomicrobiales bacterium]|nr:(2Fe-2S)-binding protein [Hyphomicrobiales bacterium]MCY4033543.1 (2Fe-2S)-binding protein [Hyphomicrobiales bacterium]MCY4039078.1 (2Fe-2S)-binding protein [Hyphomicrobiales bacterium]
MTKVSMRINGEQVNADVDGAQLLAYFLRDKLNLTGTHIGCDTSQCGACVVHLNGRAVKSCTMLAAQADGADITTIEGIQKNGELHPVQRAFQQHHALQCGFCTPGMIMAAVDIIENTNDLDEHSVREQLEGNICRCTGYQNIIAAILSAAKEMRG